MHSDDVDGAAKCGNTMTASEELLSVLRKEQQRIMELADEQHSAFERSLEAAFSRIQHLQQDLGANLSTGRRSVESIAASDLSLAQKDPEIANVRTVKPKMVDAFDPVPSPYGEFETWQRFVTPDLLPRDALCASHDSVEFEIPIGPKTSTKNMQSIPSSRSHPADGCDDRPPRSSSPTARGELAAERTDSKKLPIKSKTLERFLADTPGWAPAVKRVLDYAAGILVLVNSVVMLVELELEGRAIGRSVGYPEGRTDFGHPIGICRALNDSFSIIFFLELLVRMAIERRNFLNDLANWFDAVLAVAGLTDFFLTISLPDTSTSQSGKDIMKKLGTKVASGVSVTMQRPQERTITVERTARLGMNLNYRKGTLAKPWISTIEDGTCLIHQWNQSNPSHSVTVNDRVISVNGSALSAVDTVEKLRTATGTLTIKFVHFE